MHKETAFGNYIQEHRIQQDKSIREIASRIGISHVLLAAVERGARPALGERWWPQLAAAIPGVSLAGLKAAADADQESQRPLPMHLNQLQASLSRRIENNDIDPATYRKLLRLIRTEDEK